MTAQLDHTVINVKYKMDRAQSAFSTVGFDLTERGYHTLGSINHLMMFGSDYLELIGLPPEAENEAKPGRPDIAEADYGLNGLVFKTDDAEETARHLESLGLALGPAKSFSRPVALADGTKDAAFTTAHVKSDIFPGGRVYFCQHHTPDLVWRPEWQSHANTVSGMSEFVIVSDRHEEEAAQLGAILRTQISLDGTDCVVPLDGSQATFLSHDGFRGRYGALADNLTTRPSFFGALVFKIGSNEAAQKVLAQAENSELVETDNGFHLYQRDFRSLMVFKS